MVCTDMPGRESVPISEDRLPTREDFEAMREAFAAVAPEPERFAESAAMTTALVHEFPGWTAGQLKSLRAPVLLLFGDRDFSPLTDVAELFAMLPDARLAVLPGATHMDMTRRPAEILALITPFLDGKNQ